MTYLLVLVTHCTGVLLQVPVLIGDCASAVAARTKTKIRRVHIFRKVRAISGLLVTQNFTQNVETDSPCNVRMHRESVAFHKANDIRSTLEENKVGDYKFTESI